MRPSLTTLGFLAVVSCGHTSQPTAPLDLPGSIQRVTVTGQLTLTVTDFPTKMGIFWVAPGAQGGAGTVTAQAIRYGSLCAFAVTGRADVTGSRIAVHIAYTPRTTLCTAEIRALRYEAVVGGLAPGKYEVHILHSEGDGVPESEVRVQTVDVT